MFVFLCFLAMCLIGESEAFSLIGESEGQKCTFPSNWHNKDFKLWVDNTVIGFWNFSETTFIHDVSRVPVTYECFNIVGRFVIVRAQGRNDLRCYAIETNNADSFTALLYLESGILNFTNECSACSDPPDYFWRLSAVGTVVQNQTGPECNIPVGCTPGRGAKFPNICDDNGNIGDSNEATTHPTTPPPPTTSPATSPPKHCKHGHP